MPHVQLAGLDAPFSEDEIWAAISQMPSEKAPGPDGFTTDFYKRCWPVIKADVINAFTCVYNLHTGLLHKLNGATISLLPKKEIVESVQDYRPSSTLLLRLSPRCWH